MSTSPSLRREFLVTNLTIGFAAAVSPVTAATITTDTEGLVAGEVKIPVKDGEIPGYRAMPAKGAKHPLVLVVQEIFGVHEHIKDICRRFAKVGYCAVAPEMYARQGDVSKIENFQEIISKVVSKVPDEQVMSDLDAAVEWAVKSSKGDANRLGITGFCWGGRVVWLYSAHSKKLKAGGAWYGRLSGVSNAMTPKSALDLAGSLNAPVLGLYGEKDTGIPLTDVDKMKAALKEGSTKASKESDILVYTGAQHGFHADYRPSYSEKDAKDAWAKLIAFFQKHGVK